LKSAPITSQARPGVGFFLFGKVLPGALFAVLAVLQLEFIRREAAFAVARFPDAGSISFLLNRILSISFAAGIAIVYIVRRPPRQGRHDIGAVIVSLYASFALLALRPVLGFLQVPFGNSPPWALVISNLLVAGGAAFSIYALLYLRLNFSILPEARELTTSGPYHLVRHPVYLGEIAGAAGLAIALPNYFSLIVLGTFVAAQLVRTVIEEKVLSTVIPSYQEYAAKTPRLLPRLW